jgi:hypothetical protein
VGARHNRGGWRPGDQSPGFLVLNVAIVLVALLVSTCARAETTPNERMAYRIGVVVGAYYAYLGDLASRLTSAGIPANKVVGVMVRGCSGIDSRTLVDVVLTKEPLPKDEAEIVAQTRNVMTHACAAFQETGS